MRINHNIAALNTYRQLGAANNAQQNSMEKLSSGLRINRAGDDAAGLAISEKMRAQVRGLDQAATNAQDGISLIQTAEGGLNETHSILQRMRELAVQGANDTNEAVDRDAIQEEINNLAAEITRIGDETEFNEKKLLNGDLSTSLDAVAAGLKPEEGISNISIQGAKAGFYTVGYDNDTTTLTVKELDGTSGNVVATSEIVVTPPTGFDTKDISFGDMGITVTINANLDGDVGAGEIEVGSTGQINLQIGANEGQNMTISINNMTANALGVDALSVGDHDGAGKAISLIDTAIKTVSEERSKLGAFQNRLDHTINNLSTSSENLTAAESRIRDVDYALAA